MWGEFFLFRQFVDQLSGPAPQVSDQLGGDLLSTGDALLGRHHGNQQGESRRPDQEVEHLELQCVRSPLLPFIPPPPLLLLLLPPLSPPPLVSFFFFPLLFQKISKSLTHCRKFPKNLQAVTFLSSFRHSSFLLSFCSVSSCSSLFPLPTTCSFYSLSSLPSSFLTKLFLPLFLPMSSFLLLPPVSPRLLSLILSSRFSSALSFFCIFSPPFSSYLFLYTLLTFHPPSLCHFTLFNYLLFFSSFTPF